MAYNIIHQTYKIVFITCILISWGILGSCGDSNNTKEDNANEKIYYFPLKSLPEDLDPAHSLSKEADSVMGEIYDGLVCLNESFEVAPEIAESWEYNSKTATYTFHLREGVKFHNGKPVTAEDVKYSLQRLAMPKIKADQAEWILYVKGAREFKNGKTNDVKGLRVIDERTIDIELGINYLPFLKLLTTTMFSIVCKDAFEEYDKGQKDYFKPIGSGPFQFEKKFPDGAISLRANPDYYRHKPNLDGIIYRLVTDPFIMLDDYRDGKLHHIEIPHVIAEKVLKEDFLNDEITSYPVNQIYYFVFNLDSNQFGGTENRDSKRLVRQAINYAVDREYICKTIMEDQAKPVNYIIPSGMLDYENPLSDIFGFKYDPSKAKELLAKAGFPSGKGFKTITIHTRSNDRDRKIAEAIKNNLNDIGLTVEIALEDNETYKKIGEKKFAFFANLWIMQYPDIDDYLALFHGKNARGGKNLANITRDYINELIDKSERIDDPAQLKELYVEIEKELWYDCPWLFLFRIKNILLINRNVKGLKEQICQLDFYESIPHVRMEEVDLVSQREDKKR